MSDKKLNFCVFFIFVHAMSIVTNYFGYVISSRLKHCQIVAELLLKIINKSAGCMPRENPSANILK